jgi:threonine dehydrogenase-like Zn-dependent dehydrogenase
VRRQARGLGLDAAAPDAALAPAPLVADVSATPKGLGLALRLTAPDGICTSSGSLHSQASIPTALMFGRNVTLTLGRTHARVHIPKVLELMARGELRPELVTTLVAPLDDAPSALAEHMRGSSTKTIVAA